MTLMNHELKYALSTDYKFVGYKLKVSKGHQLEPSGTNFSQLHLQRLQYDDK